MLTKVKAYSSWRSATPLGLSELGPQTDPIQIRNIEGLGPVKSSVNTEPYGSIDGESLTGITVPARNIVLTLGLNPDWATWTPASLRRLIYSYFSPKQQVKLIFESDDEFPDVTITGYVESADPSMFDKDSEMQISIICPDPYFYAVDPVEISGVTGEGPIEIDYIGSVETGINVRVNHVANPLPVYVGIQLGDPSETFFRSGGYPTPTIYWEMNSIPGNKYVRMVSLTTGVITNLLHHMESGSSWPVMYPGENTFEVLTDAGEQDWVLTYIPKFGGL